MDILSTFIVSIGGGSIGGMIFTVSWHFLCKKSKLEIYSQMHIKATEKDQKTIIDMLEQEKDKVRERLK